MAGCIRERWRMAEPTTQGGGGRRRTIPCRTVTCAVCSDGATAAVGLKVPRATCCPVVECNVHGPSAQFGTVPAEASVCRLQDALRGFGVRREGERVPASERSR